MPHVFGFRKSRDIIGSREAPGVETVTLDVMQLRTSLTFELSRQESIEGRNGTVPLSAKYRSSRSACQLEAYKPAAFVIVSRVTINSESMLWNDCGRSRKACPPRADPASIECGRCGSGPRMRSRFGANGAPWRQASGSMAADAAVVRRGRCPPLAVLQSHLPD